MRTLLLTVFAIAILAGCDQATRDAIKEERDVRKEQRQNEREDRDLRRAEKQLCGGASADAVDRAYDDTARRADYDQYCSGYVPDE